ncbi:MAG: hypothetical protein WCL16_01405 [bacterium]
MTGRTFVGFGFGAIQSGLFTLEAFRSGRFQRLVVAEVLPEVVAAVRAAGGAYMVNVATATGIETRRVEGVEILNPRDPADRVRLVDAIASAQELGTALPSVDFFDRGDDSVAHLLAGGLARKAAQGGGPRCLIYTGENHNHAAELLRAACAQQLGAAAGAVLETADFLNTVIGKMSGVVSDAAQISNDALQPMTPGGSRAILVEAFNRIYISRIRWADFDRGLALFVEKADLLPFEEAKLYGHNAVHAWLGYLANEAGCVCMSDVARQAPALLDEARAVFLEESGAALRFRHHGLDPLFTDAGWAAYADDLLTRMMNPWLRDRVERVIRDAPRKLAWDDRLIGSMRLTLDAGVTPVRFAHGAAAAARQLPPEITHGTPAAKLASLWAAAPDTPPGRKARLLELCFSDT